MLLLAKHFILREINGGMEPHLLTVFKYRTNPIATFFQDIKY
jgi:hypothetical protein